ncbi:MAG: DUF4097 family beta strand repeat-containing protein [bacterium]|nr:DUF4097 family beta strand repeat-containing protein [bacterium]
MLIFRMKNALTRYSLPILLLVLLASPGLMRAQSVIPADETPGLEKKKSKASILSPEQLELVREYLDVLEQIDRLTTDYSRYLKSHEDLAASEYLKAISDFRKQMSDNKYLLNIEHLKQGVAELKEKINLKKEKQEDSETRKAYKLALALFKDLEGVDDLIEFELNEKLLKQEENAEKINQYLELKIEKSLSNLRREKSDRGQGIVTTIILDTTLIGDEVFIVSVPTALVAPELAFLNLNRPTEVPQVEVPASLPDVPAPPLPPTPPVRVIDRDIIFQDYDGRTSLTRTFTDSSGELSGSIPIQIHNPIGNLKISAWGNNYVRVTAKLKVLAKDQSKARIFANKINLHLYLQNDILFVNPEIPTLSDPSTQIANNNVEIMVPYDNPVVCQSSFGEILIAGLENNLKVSSDNSSVAISNIKGKIVAMSNNGPVTLRNCQGPVNVKSSMGAINVLDCEGKMELHNTFSVTRLKRCESDVTLKGEGQIDISDHSGTIKIFNRNGQVRVVRSQGDVSISNSNGPSFVALIEGSATIKSLNASVHAESISGLFTASNSNAPIMVSGIGGPLTLSNEYGTISVDLDEIINGDSRIESNYGQINIRLTEDQDLAFNVYSIGGDIRTALPLAITESGGDKKLEHIFGNGDSKLTIHSKSGMVMISE